MSQCCHCQCCSIIICTIAITALCSFSLSQLCAHWCLTTVGFLLCSAHTVSCSYNICNLLMNGSCFSFVFLNFMWDSTAPMLMVSSLKLLVHTLQKTSYLLSFELPPSHSLNLLSYCSTYSS